MGVKGLWSILSELCERKPLTYLSGKKVAVDLSGWVMQAFSCQGLNTSKSPHLKTLFFRVSCLLKLGAYPIFITEGKPPDLKEASFKKRNCDYSCVSRSAFDKTLAECEDFLNALGIPCIKSSGEAEAFCAFLCSNGIVDGVMTEDNDAFLYGAEVIYRDFSMKACDSHIDVYCLKSEKNRKNLDRKKLVALALLLGGDYNLGVPGIGKETAIKLLCELNCEDVLLRFKEWKDLNESELFPGLEHGSVKKGAHCNRCLHSGLSSEHKKSGCQSCNSQFTCYLPEASNPCRCPWHCYNEIMCKRKTELKIYNIIKNISNFPDMKVVDEYLNFTDTIPSNEMLDWKRPNLMEFRRKALSYFGWTFQSSQEKFLPLITSWQQYRLLLDDKQKTEFVYEPVEILKERSIKDVSHFEVKWKIINDDCDYDISEENLVTTEYGDRFCICYKELVSDFYRELNEQKQAKAKSKKRKYDEGNKKIEEFFDKKHQLKNVEKSKETISLEPMDDSQSCVPHSESGEQSSKKLCV